MPGESADQTTFLDADKEYEISIKTYNVVMDNVVESMNERFIKHEALYNDFACFEPKRYGDMRKHGLPDGSLDKISDSLKGKVDRSALRNQLESFAYSFEHLAKTLPEEYDGTIMSEEPFADEDEKEVQSENTVMIEQGLCRQKGVTCRQCIPCAFQVLYKYNLNSTSYNDLYVAYQYLPTLAVTQVQCERVF